MMMNEIIELGKIYYLDLGGSSPVEVKPLSFSDTGVECEYLSSWSGRIEEIEYHIFEMNGYFKPNFDNNLYLSNDSKNSYITGALMPCSIIFNVKNVEVMRIDEEGFYWKGKLIENDKEIYQQMKKFLSGRLYNDL